MCLCRVLEDSQLNDFAVSQRGEEKEVIVGFCHIDRKRGGRRRKWGFQRWGRNRNTGMREEDTESISLDH